MGEPRTLADHSRVLDLDEAERLLPLVRTIAARIDRRVALRHRLEDELTVLEVLIDTSEQTGADFHEFVDKKIRYHRLGGQIDALVDRLAALGVALRDRDATYADFTCLRDDGLAAFCWRRGEGGITHWHRLHEAHARRRALPPAD